MGEQVEIDILANDKATPAWKAQANAVHAYLAELAKLDATQKANERSAAAFEKSAKKAIEEGLTPLERYNRKLGELKTLLDKNAISQEVYNRNVKNARVELDGVSATHKALGSVGSQLLGMASGWLSISTAISYAREEQQKFREANKKDVADSEAAALRQEASALRFQVQAGLDSTGSAAAQKKLRSIAQDTATTNESIGDIATELVSSGASADTATGRGTRAIAQLIKAQGLRGNNINSSEITDSITKYLNSQGLALNDENIEMLTRKLQSGGIKSTKIKVTDLAFLAKEGTGLKSAGVSMDDQLSTFATISDQLVAGTAGEQYRHVAENLAIAGSRKDRVQALKQLHLKPSDVDMVGEDLDTALSRFFTALEKLPKEKHQAIKATIFESANSSGAEAIWRSKARKDAVKAGLSDTAEFDTDVKTMTSGRVAAETRQKNAQENQEADRGSYAAIYRKAIEEEEKAKGTSPYYRDKRLGWYDHFTSNGYTPEMATRGSALNPWYAQQFAWSKDGTIEDFDSPEKQQDFQKVEGRVRSSLGGDKPLQELKATRRAAKLGDQTKQAGTLGNDVFKSFVQSEGFSTDAKDVVNRLIDKSGGNTVQGAALENEATAASNSGNAAIAAELREMVKVVEKLAQSVGTVNQQNQPGKPLEVKIIDQAPMKFEPKTDPLPASPRPAAGLGA